MGKTWELIIVGKLKILNLGPTNISLKFHSIFIFLIARVFVPKKIHNENFIFLVVFFFQNLHIWWMQGIHVARLISLRFFPQQEKKLFCTACKKKWNHFQWICYFFTLFFSRNTFWHFLTLSSVKKIIFNMLQLTW